MNGKLPFAGLILFAFLLVVFIALKFINHDISGNKIEEAFESEDSMTASTCNCLPGYVASNTKTNIINGTETLEDGTLYSVLLRGSYVNDMYYIVYNMPSKNMTYIIPSDKTCGLTISAKPYDSSDKSNNVDPAFARYTWVDDGGLPAIEVYDEIYSSAKFLIDCSQIQKSHTVYVKNNNIQMYSEKLDEEGLAYSIYAYLKDKKKLFRIIPMYYDNIKKCLKINSTPSDYNKNGYWKNDGGYLPVPRSMGSHYDTNDCSDLELEKTILDISAPTIKQTKESYFCQSLSDPTKTKKCY